MAARQRGTQWTEEGVSSKLCWLASDDRKGNSSRSTSLPPALFSQMIAPFLHFDGPMPGQLYVLGGRDNAQNPLDVVEMFDAWHGRWVTCPAMTVRRAGCAAAALPDGRLLVAGGYDEKGIVGGVLGSCEVFDPASQVWSRNCAGLRRARWGHGCAELGGLVYAVGGCALIAGSIPREELMETLRACEVYDPSADTWSPAASLNVARAGARLVAIAGG
ncbi:unnamed protein product, partial [Polarella glacialis]